MLQSPTDDSEATAPLPRPPTTFESELNNDDVGAPAMNTPPVQDIPAVSGLLDESTHHLTDSPQQVDETGIEQTVDTDVHGNNRSDIEEEEGQIIE